MPTSKQQEDLYHMIRYRLVPGRWVELNSDQENQEGIFFNKLWRNFSGKIEVSSKGRRVRQKILDLLRNFDVVSG